MKTAAIAAIAAGALLAVAAVPVATVTLLAAATTATCWPAAVTADGSPTILGPSTLTSDQIAQWWQASGHGPVTPLGVDIATLAGWYINGGNTEGVRGDYAFAQAVEETTQAGIPFNSPAALRNNFAGIGITGTAAQGYDYPNPHTGVIAQLQLLKEVAAGNNTTFPEPKVAPNWGGRPAATWAGLAGNWAAAADYWDPNIKTIYASMAAQTKPSQPGVQVLSAPSTCATPAVLTAAGDLGSMWAFLAEQLGKPYQWGGTGPGSWDCSGLMMVAWAQVGVNLPRTAAAQYQTTKTAGVPVSDMRAGDLVFWGSGSAESIDHVAIYLGNNQVLDAPHTGTVVQIQPLWTQGLFAVTRPAALAQRAATREP